MPRIGMSHCGEKDGKYEAYLRNMQSADVVIIRKGMEAELENCSALVLTGGQDVAPELYGDWADETVHVDSERDGSEFKLIDIAMKREMPILGICRGLQILNVYFGGTLVLDLEKYYSRNHRALSDNEDRYHEVRLSSGSKLKEFVQENAGQVNSAHHQAADRIGSGLKVAARAEDGTVEAVEGIGELFARVISVQWHPERMQIESPFARGVLDLFGSYVSHYHNSENYVHGG